jgi:hypothetical protein
MPDAVKALGSEPFIITKWQCKAPAWASQSSEASSHRLAGTWVAPEVPSSAFRRPLRCPLARRWRLWQDGNPSHERAVAVKPYSMELRQRVLADCDAGMKTAAVAQMYSVSEFWVRRLK